MTRQDFERKSSAYTLSDMEVFIFPELIYSLVLANIMSPRLWRWRDDSWFRKIDSMTPYRRIMRVKQFIMDHYAFNLDLDTWGLTTKEEQLARFNTFIDEDTLKRSNALFGYEGDKYYFDIGIRTHFGLDKYEGNVIPYWKTETLEAMDAFRHKAAYGNGAGECVSLSTLYAAALFVVARIPLNDIYLMATPLHSQNFIDLDDGMITNNRRVVTKNMWFNGTELSSRSRRAIENEKVTVVAHQSGCVHTVYPDATIDPAAYDRFSAKLRAYLRTDFEDDTLSNFLRQHSEVQKCFQLRWHALGTDRYIQLERIFAYEHGSSFLLNEGTREKLMSEIDGEEFHPQPIPGRIMLNDVESFVRENKISLEKPEDVKRLEARFVVDCMNAPVALEKLIAFCNVKARLPDLTVKNLQPETGKISLETSMSRDEIIEQLRSIRSSNRMADLAFYAYRDLRAVEPGPFLYSAVHRNPVSISATVEKTFEQALALVKALPDESIYDESGRLAHPDEVWNYGRGDGVEKAVLLANLALARKPESKVIITIHGSELTCTVDGTAYQFSTRKQLPDCVWDINELAS